MRKVVNVSENDPRYEEFVNLTKTALVLENLHIIAKGSKNTKDINSIAEKNGITFYVADEVYLPDEERDAIVYKENPTKYEIAVAKANMFQDARICDLMDILYEREGTPVDMWNGHVNTMAVITNVSKANGAGVIFCDEVLKLVYQKVGTFFIIPSSIHEVIIFPSTDRDLGNQIAEIVKAVNVDAVREEDQLSDEAFFYDGNDWN